MTTQEENREHIWQTMRRVARVSFIVVGIVFLIALFPVGVGGDVAGALVLLILGVGLLSTSFDDRRWLRTLEMVRLAPLDAKSVTVDHSSEMSGERHPLPPDRS